jgi:hypothetical protein
LKALLYALSLLIYQFKRRGKSESALDSHFLRACPANFSTSRRIKAANVESRKTFAHWTLRVYLLKSRFVRP